MKRVALACVLVLVILAAWHPVSQAAPADPDPPAFAPDEVLVQYRDGVTDAQRGRTRARVNGSPKRQLRPAQAADGGLEVVTVRGVDVRAAIATLQADPAVLFAEPNWRLTRPPLLPAADSSDRGYTNGSHWGLYGESTTPANVYGSQAGEAWANGYTGGATVYVGVIDEGIRYTHCDLAPNIGTNPGETGTYTIKNAAGQDETYDRATDGKDNDGNKYTDDVRGWDFYHDDNTIYDPGQDNHGTHVSGTIGSAANNPLCSPGADGNGGSVGVNWDVKILSGKFLGPDGGDTADAYRAVEYFTALKTRAVNPVNVVALNNSWGGGGYSQALHAAIIRAAKADILFIAAAGNSASNNDARASYPSNYNTLQGAAPETAARYDSVIAVAAIDKAGNLAGFSSYGRSTVDLGAPGVDIWSTVADWDAAYAPYSGTSMATPHVTGAAALYAAANGLTCSAGGVGANAQTCGSQIRTALLNAAKTRYTPSLYRKTVTNGRLDISCMKAPSGAMGVCR